MEEKYTMQEIIDQLFFADLVCPYFFGRSAKIYDKQDKLSFLNFFEKALKEKWDVETQKKFILYFAQNRGEEIGGTQETNLKLLLYGLWEYYCGDTNKKPIAIYCEKEWAETLKKLRDKIYGRDKYCESEKFGRILTYIEDLFGEEEKKRIAKIYNKTN